MNRFRVSIWLVCPAAALVVAACGGKSGAQQADGGAAMDGPAAAPASSRDARNRVPGLKEIQADMQAALAAEDWAKAGRLADQGASLATGQGKDADLIRARFVYGQAEVARRTGRLEDARRLYTDALAAFHVFSDTDGKFLVNLAMGQLEEQRGDQVSAERHFAESEAMLPQITDRRLTGVFEVEMGKLAVRQVKHEEAYRRFANALKIFEAASAKADAAETLLALATEEDGMERGASCARSLEKALRIFREVGDPKGEVRALHRLASLAVRDRQYAKARGLLEKTIELYERLDNRSSAAAVRRDLAALPE
jgi:tetratricopeptide (TPR) repeat protein